MPATGAPLGALMLGAPDQALPMVAAGALGGGAVGAARSLLDLAVPPPGPNTRAMRGIVFTGCACLMGSAFGAALLGSRGVVVSEACEMGVVGTTVLMAVLGLAALWGDIIRSMFVEDPY